jgi:UDP-N-acetylmuramate dehydrogenase
MSLGLPERLVERAMVILGPRARTNWPLGPLTTYRVGGAAAIFVKAEGIKDLANVSMAVAETGLPVLVFGRGSNLLVADAGFRGIAVTLGSEYETIALDPAGPPELSCQADPDTVRTVRAGGASYLPVLARRCATAGLGGLEWAVGIPGSVGGGVSMNAGGHGADVKSVIVGAELYDLGQGAQIYSSSHELGLGYRRSALTQSQVVLGAVFSGRREDPGTSRARIDEIVRWRRAHQPGGSNAGSVFVNPPGDTAGRLVEEAGLKGLRIGSAQVSTMHANFIQASQGGSADDVADLIGEVRKRVADRTGTELAVECRLVGNFLCRSSRE